MLFIGQLMRPIVAMPPPLVAIIEQGAHVNLDPTVPALCSEVGSDIVQIEFDLVALHIEIHAQDIVLAAGIISLDLAKRSFQRMAPVPTAALGFAKSFPEKSSRLLCRAAALHRR